MRLRSVEGNSQRLDGGAMFGNCPKALWTRWVAPDEQNRIPLACRALLIEEEDRKILCETGIGCFFPPKLRERFGVVESRHCLLENLAGMGLSHEEIDVVVLSHLHFDHAGGLLSPFDADSPPRLLFPNAQFVVGKEAWERCQSPHPRDRASYIPELPKLLLDSGRLVVMEEGGSELLPAPRYRVYYSQGHTPGLMLLEVATPKGPIVFGGDLVPGVPWVHLPITMGYDRYPELLIDEKRTLLADLLRRDGHLFFTHDHKISAGKVQQDERGRFGVQACLESLDWQC